MSKTFEIKEIIDLSENSTLSVISREDMQMKCICVIKDEKINVYFDDGSKKSFEDNVDEFMGWIDDNDYVFIKRMNGPTKWKKYNPNPKGRNIGDCTLRSYCAAFGITWDEAFDIATKIAKKESSLIAHVSDKVLTDHFHMKVDKSYPGTDKKKVTVNEFAFTHPYGTYVLHVRGHQVTVKDGEYWDSWDSGERKINKIFVMPTDK